MSNKFKAGQVVYFDESVSGDSHPFSGSVLLLSRHDKGGLDPTWDTRIVDVLGPGDHGKVSLDTYPVFESEIIKVLEEAPDDV